MVELDGKKYTVKTASENTQDMLTTINEYCASHDIRNSKGELIEIEARMSSPLYCILWALGYLATAIQNLIYSVGANMNVQAASNTQVLNLAAMANVKRGSASVTTVNIQVTAKTDEDEGYDAETGTCTITTEDTITVNGIVYKPAVYPSAVLQAGDVRTITVIAQSAGTYDIAPETITAFDTTILNLKSVYQPSAAIPGQSQESIASLRERLQRRQISGTFIDRAMDAIRELPGVTLCNIYYNMSKIISQVVGDAQDYCTIPPRWALLIVQGYNQNIAEAYLSYMTAQTVQWTEQAGGDIVITENVLSPAARTNGRLLAIQIYTTHANQKIPVLIVRPRQKQVYIKVHIGLSVESSIEQELKTAVSKLSAALTVGQSITSAMILDSLAAYKSYQLLGAYVSSDEGSTWGYTSIQEPDLIWTFNTQNIIIVMPEAE